LIEHQLIIPEDNKELRLHQRGLIEELKDAIETTTGSTHGDRDQINEGLQEFIVGGAYTRVLHIPADTTIVSELWKKDRLWIIISGVVGVKSEEGDMLIEAPYIGKAPYGSRIALYAQTDVLWAAITGLPETENLEEVESVLKAEDYSEFTYPWDLLENDS
jgi:hypothetical protein